jgi:hypothetical protein
MLDAILGPLGGILAGVAAAVLAWVLGRQQGKSGERERRAGQDAKDYHDGRKKIDAMDLGHGATDIERINRLRDIADRRGAGRD